MTDCLNSEKCSKARKLFDRIMTDHEGEFNDLGLTKPSLAEKLTYSKTVMKAKMSICSIHVLRDVDVGSVPRAKFATDVQSLSRAHKKIVKASWFGESFMYASKKKEPKTKYRITHLKPSKTKWSVGTTVVGSSMRVDFPPAEVAALLQAKTQQRKRVRMEEPLPTVPSLVLFSLGTV